MMENKHKKKGESSLTCQVNREMSRGNPSERGGTGERGIFFCGQEKDLEGHLGVCSIIPLKLWNKRVRKEGQGTMKKTKGRKWGHKRRIGQTVAPLVV